MILRNRYRWWPCSMSLVSIWTFGLDKCNVFLLSCDISYRYPAGSMCIFLRSRCRLGKACCEACPNRLVVSGRVFLAGVRPDAPSWSDTFSLLRVWPQGLGVAVELGRTRCVRHSHLRVARLFRQLRRSSNG